MPTQNSSSLGGYNKAITANTVKDGSTVVKAGGTYAAPLGSNTSVATPAVFLQYNVAMSNSGVAAWDTVGFATSTSNVNAPNEIRKLIDTTPASPIYDLDNGQSYKTTDRDVNKIGFRQNINGQWVTLTSGHIAVNLATTGYSAVAANGGSTVDTDRIGRSSTIGQDYSFKMGGVNAEVILPVRTQ